ncbi:MAG: bifunctional diaminohydroxyphosphoribosylaminopyrimidine deaminase/5-amino-6-(5-phosphoribosylamino)uracil reductase RibD, partial [Deltaproteobacteria bacterium]|nr:bifunctional diaminohydroxyphosphoribosylaminopyrimidine deaminase/5-amino-6-(5-phosphoribosylamino)uracil reductase RibD [Deltaproteobacteria bacterium]
IVKEDRIIGVGYHQRCGQNHAEINAIENATESTAGSTLYVTLEPCCHFGKTPPCTDRIIQNKIGRVVIGCADSNPLVSCRGINQLRGAGIEVKAGVREGECRNLNEVFFHFMEKGLPFVTVKYAQTLDGRIATTTGKSQWISSPSSLKFAHQLRAQHDAILVGIGTVLQDNPTLTVRNVRGRSPLRIVLDSRLDIPVDANVMQNLSELPTLIVTTKPSSDPDFQKLTRAGADVVTIDPDRRNHADLKKLLPLLAARTITSILIEGGAEVITSALRDNLVNRLVAIIAPKIIGKGIEAIGDLNIRDLENAKLLSVRHVLKKGADIIIDGRL